MDLEPEYPEIPCSTVSKKSLFSLLLSFFRCPKTHHNSDSEQGADDLPLSLSVWQVAGSGAVVALKPRPL